MKFGQDLPRSFFEVLQSQKISKFEKSQLGKFIPNIPLKHVITSTNKRGVHIRLKTIVNSEQIDSSVAVSSCFSL